MEHYGAERQKQVCGCGMLREKPPLRGVLTRVNNAQSAAETPRAGMCAEEDV
nr:MAG TPA: hypothetical protein [Caudoviricetes sp.]